MGRVRSYRAFSPLPHRLGPVRRYLSVALVLGSPPAGVTRYPCPAEPGLSSSSAFRHESAAVRPGRGNIVTQESQIVKHLANFPHGAYTIGTNASGRGAVNWCLKVRTQKTLSLRTSPLSWCGNPPVRGEMYRIAPHKMGVSTIFGGNRYLVPFNRGIAATSVRTGLAMTALYFKHQFVVPIHQERIYLP